MYRDGSYIARAVESVLSQTFTDFEYLFVNDACVDNSRDIVASYRDPRIRIIDNERNMGLAASLNRGLALAQGELIGRFDANDICFPERLAKQVAYFDAHPEIAAAGVQTQIINTAGRRLRRAESSRPVTPLGIAWCSMFEVPILHPGSMFRRSIVLDELGGYDETVSQEDAELWLRILRNGYPLGNLDEQLMAMRVDPRSISGNIAVREARNAKWVELAIANMQLQLQQEDIPEEWQRAWVAINHPGITVSGSDIERFIAVVDACFARFCELHPEARENAEIAMQRAAMFSLAADKAAMSARRYTFRVFRRMVALERGKIVKRLPRLVILWVAGERSVRMWRRWRRRSR